jgi:hypothetical protein
MVAKDLSSAWTSESKLVADSIDALAPMRMSLLMLVELLLGSVHWELLWAE